GLRFFSNLLKFRFGNPFNGSLQIELYGGDTPIFKRHLCIRMEVAGCVPFLTKQETELHGKTTRMRRAYRLFWVCSYPLFEARLVRISGFIQYGTLGADCTTAVFPGALPVGTCFSCKFHRY